MNARAAIAVLLLAAASGSALAGTNVGGPINVNTTWTVAGAPYTVTSDVTVGSGATLTIDAGVTVYMNAGTNLVVASGSLAAVGRPPSPIVITSFRDVPNPNPVPAPGDWGQLQFGAGTIAGATQLDFVSVKYGNGVSIAGASPALNHVTLLNNAGPAITVDLASSPTGGGLVATGNTLNGILVPAGDINADVTWGLTGIPYVVAQGVVNVGAPAPLLTLSPASATVGIGYTLPMTLTSTLAAPAGGLAVTLTSSNGAAVSVPASVTIPATATGVGFNASGVAAGSATVTAHASGYVDATALLTAQAANIGVPANLLVAPGLNVSLPITLSIPAPPGGVTVNLASDKGSVATVTASVAFAAGASTGTATVTGVAAGTATITATASGYGAGTTGVTVANVTLDVSPSGTINVPQGVTQSYQVKLSQAAPAGGVTVNVVTGNAATATVSPASVTVAQGQTLSAATIDVQGVATGATTLTLSAAGLNSKVVTVNVLGQGNMQFNHASVVLGKGLTITAGSSQYLVKLFSGAAVFFNPVPVTVTLTSSDPSKVSVPPTLVIPAGNSFVDLTLSGIDITTAPVTITATAAGYQPAPISVSVVAPSVLFQSLDNARVTTNTLRDDFTVRWSVPDGFNPSQTSTADIALDLSITDQIPAGIVPGFHSSGVGGSVVTQLTIPAGQNASGTAYVDQATVAGSYTVTASAPGIGSGTSGVQTVTSPALQLPVAVTIGAGMTSVPNQVTVTRTGSTAVAIDVALSCAPASVCSVPATVTIPVAATSVSVPLTGVANGSATLSATSAGYSAASSPIVTETPHFSIGSPGSTVAVGSTLAISIGFGGNGEVSETFATDVILTLSSSAPGVASIPATLTIPAGTTFASTQILGVSAGTVTFTVSSPGFAPASTSAYTVTAPPTLSLFPVTGQVGIGNTLAMSVVSNQAAPAGGLPVQLSSSNSGFVSVPASVVIPGFGSSAQFNATGVANGTATITGHATGYVDGTATITGGLQALHLTNSQVAIGQTRTLTVTLSNPAPAGGLTISLQSSDTNIATVPSSINVPAGATSATFDAFGVGNGSPFAFTYINAGFWAVTLTATAPAYQTATSGFAVSNFVIDLRPVTSFDIPQGVVQTYQVALTSQSPTEDVVISLASADAGTLTVTPASVTVLAGQRLAAATIDVTGIAKGTTTVDATAVGLAPVSFNANVVDPGMLVFSPASMVLGKGMLTSDLVVQLMVAGSPFVSPVPVTVSLTSSDPAKVGVPASIATPAGYDRQYITVSGVDLSATPVSISATNAAGYANPSPADVTVQPPSFEFLGLASVRVVNNRRDAFNIVILPPASNVTQRLINSLNIDLSITDQVPAGIVGGFYDQVAGGSLITQVSLPALYGITQGVTAVGPPTTAGTYTVTASVPGLASTTSAVQTVSSNATLVFTINSYVVGKGLSYQLQIERHVDGNFFGDDGPMVVNLTSSDPSKVSVPVSVTIPADSYYAMVPITGVDITGTPVSIDASAANYASPSTKLSVSVVAPHLVFGSLDEARRLDSVEDNFYMAWYVPENLAYPYGQLSAADTTVQLAITDQSPAGVVDGIFGDSGTITANQLVIPAGSNSGNGYVGRPLVPSGTYTVTATATGAAATTVVSTVQTVTTAAPVVSFSLSAAVVGVGFTTPADYQQLLATRTVLGFPFYAADDAIVTLDGVDSNSATVPATLTIPASVDATPFQIVGLQPASMTVSATAAGYVTGPTLDLQIVYPILEFAFSVVPPQVSVDGTLDFYVNVYAPNANPFGQVTAIDFTVNLAVANANILSLPTAFYTIPSGTSVAQAYFQVVGVALGTSTVTASSPNLNDVVSDPIQVVP